MVGGNYNFAPEQPLMKWGREEHNWLAKSRSQKNQNITAWSNIYLFQVSNQKLRQIDRYKIKYA